MLDTCRSFMREGNMLAIVMMLTDIMGPARSRQSHFCEHCRREMRDAMRNTVRVNAPIPCQSLNFGSISILRMYTPASSFDMFAHATGG